MTMTPEQIKAGLATLDPSHAFYVALMEVLKSDIDDEIAGATAPNLADGARQFNTGRLAHAREVPAMIEGVMREAWRERLEADKRREAAAEKGKS
jgi:hypothetical protein